MLKDLLKKIKSPAPEFRGAPFWAWNGKLSPKELRTQIRLMKEMGLGGFFMHSRVGLDTKYLTPEWFRCIRACTDEAEKQGMHAWLYDEDRWPSGAAGGIVTKDPQFRMHFLQLTILNDETEMTESTEHTLGIYAGVFGKEDSLISLRKLASSSDKRSRKEKLLYVTMQTAAPDSWYNDQTYLDTLNPAAVREFIRVTHEQYRKHEGKNFHHAVPGIFTDEPTYRQGHRGIALPWTPALPERFREKYSYSVLDHLPELFCRIGNEIFSKIRLDYYNLVTELFVTSFSKQIGEWCEKNNLEFTGHVLCEDHCTSQKSCVGAAMRFYEYMQSPGIDVLTEHGMIYPTAKQCVSMAHQFGRKTRLSETYGCTGWDFPFAGHKAVSDWQAALGINLRCQHLAWYTMAGEAKRDYPACIFYQSPWYREYPVVENYFARLHAFLSEGEEVRDLLMIHPIESVFGLRPLFGQALRQSLHPGTGTEDAEKAEREAQDLPLVRLTNKLLAEHLDFDFGDEEILSRHASVKGTAFRVEKALYRAVLIPELLTIRKSTLALLKRFADAGGSVFYLGKAPARVDGKESTEAAEIYRFFRRTTEEKMGKDLSPAVRKVSVKEGKKEIAPVLYQLRKAGDFQTLFLCNTGVELPGDSQEGGMVRDRSLVFPDAEISVKTDKGFSVWELDLMTGTFYAVKALFRDGVLRFRTAFDPLASRAFLIAKKVPENLSARPAAPQRKSVRKLAAEKLDFRLDEENLLVLDHPAWRTGKGKWNPETFFLIADDLLRKKLGKAPRGGRMCQPWTRNSSPEKTLPADLKYSFRILSLPEEEVFLAVERPDVYEFTLNGKRFPAEECGFWCDHSIRKLRLPPELLRKGNNELLLHTDYHEQLPGVESLFLMGKFGVKDDCITTLPESLSAGDWTKQKLPCYAGNLTYIFEFQSKTPERELFLTIPEWRGSSLGVSVNGGERVSLPWPPYTLSLKGKLHTGKNRIEITVFGHRRNAFGPFYKKEKWPSWTGPEGFREMETEDRQLVPCGLLRPPEITD